MYKRALCGFFFLLSVVFPEVITCWSAPTGSSLPQPPVDTITTIIISGNKKTETSVIKHLSKITIGDTIDSSAVHSIRKRLLRSGLFSKVDILLHPTPGGVRVYIILSERFYLLPYDFGGELYGYRYGKRKTWWRLRVGMENSNFRGKAEVLRTSFSFWDWRSLGIGWYKPILPSPYYFSVGASADILPDEVFRIDHTILRSYLSFGRKLPASSRVGASIIPLYRRRILFDSTLVPADTVRVYEAFCALSFQTDHRNRRFDPTAGWMFSFSSRTNTLYTRVAPPYTQINAELRSYLPGLARSHRFAFRSTLALRDTDAGVTHRLLLGGESSIRGYYRNLFGRYFTANNTFTFSAEYRFPLYELTNIPLFPLDQLYSAFSSITCRFDGALLFDYGRVSSRYNQLFSIKSSSVERGSGIGCGLRMVTPELQRTICFDVAWGTSPTAAPGYLTFLKQPISYLYLDTYF